MKINIKKASVFFSLIISSALIGQTNIPDKGSAIVLETKTGKIRGTMLSPDNKAAVPVVLIISGSGPTDRDGNNMMMKNNSLKMLAEELLKNNIASVRYDKRGIAESKDAGVEEKNMRFDDLVGDASEWIKILKQDKRFSKVLVAGHSEGSLIGMIAAKNAGADGFISIAGAGRAADEILKEQLKSQPESVTSICYPILDSLKKGRTVDSVPKMLYSLFRPSVQPYMISWFKYDPQIELKKLNIPILILQGTTDIQVSESDAKLLFDSNNRSEYHLIKGMNHILKEAEEDRQKNIATYSDPGLPIKNELISDIVNFITTIK
jgi:pimeloyl-ACP methyl ester carboxylesterase